MSDDQGMKKKKLSVFSTCVLQFRLDSFDNECYGSSLIFIRYQKGHIMSARDFHHPKSRKEQ